MTDIVRQFPESHSAPVPLLSLPGISPPGFSAAGGSDPRSCSGRAFSRQEKVIRPSLDQIPEVVQDSVSGGVDNSIVFGFRPLSPEDELSNAQSRRVNIGSLCQILDRDVIFAEEVRSVLIADPGSGLNNLYPADLPEQESEQGQSEGGMPETPETDVGGPAHDGNIEIDANPFHNKNNGQFATKGNGERFPLPRTTSLKKVPKSEFAAARENINRYINKYAKFDGKRCLVFSANFAFLVIPDKNSLEHKFLSAIKLTSNNQKSINDFLEKEEKDE